MVKDLEIQKKAKMISSIVIVCYGVCFAMLTITDDINRTRQLSSSWISFIKSVGIKITDFSFAEWNICNRFYFLTLSVQFQKMLWSTVPCFVLIGLQFMDCVSAGNQCREEKSVNGMALKGFVFKKFTVRALHECDISCETEITCQSYNYHAGEKSCELNNRTKEARPDNFHSDPAWFYKRRLAERGMLSVMDIYVINRAVLN